MKRSSALLSLVVVLSACQPDEDTTDSTDTSDTTDTVPTPNQAPGISLGVPSTAEAGVETTISGMATDAEDAAETLTVSLNSSLDGLLWSGQPDNKGVWSWSGTLSAGTHELVAEVTDSASLSATTTAILEVLPKVVSNQPPTCEVLQPTANAILPVGQPVTFEASWSDPDHSPAVVSTTWVTDKGEILGLGSLVQLIRPEGTQTVTFVAADPEGAECRESVTFSVGQPTLPPTPDTGVGDTGLVDTSDSGTSDTAVLDTAVKDSGAP